MTVDIRKDEKIIQENLQKYKNKKQMLYKIYSYVIYVITRGKFCLLNSCEAMLLSKEGDLCCKMFLENPEDVHKARELTQQVLEAKGFTVQNLMHLQLCVSEAATNVLKHAGSGQLEIRKVNDSLRIIFCDNGPGMEYDKLPHMILLKGFSTQTSMGVGFSLIYKYASKIYLSTSENGTLLLLDFWLSKQD